MAAGRARGGHRPPQQAADRVPARRPGRRRSDRRASPTPAQQVAVGRNGSCGWPLGTVAAVASRAWVAPAQGVLGDRQWRLRELTTTVGAAPVPVSARQSPARTGVGRGAGGAHTTRVAAAVQAVRPDLDPVGSRLPDHGRQAVLPRWDVPGPARGRSDRNRRVATARLGPRRGARCWVARSCSAASSRRSSPYPSFPPSRPVR